MAEIKAVMGELPTVQHLVELLEQDGFHLDAAVWVLEEDGRSRLFLVPNRQDHDERQQMLCVLRTLSSHREELPEGRDFPFSVVSLEHPLIQAARGVGRLGRVRGLYHDGTYVDTAYILKSAA